MKNVDWKGVVVNILDYEGFTYLITNNIDGRKYIGAKLIYNLKNKGTLRVESNWKMYRSSSKELQKDIRDLGQENFTFEILELFKTRASMNKREVELQIESNVLNEKQGNGSRMFYNKNINGRSYVCIDDDVEAYKEMCQNISDKLKQHYANGAIHPLQGKEHPNKGKKLPQTGHDKNKGRITFTNGVDMIRLKEGDIVPEGYYKGVPKKHGLKRWIEKHKTKCLLNREHYNLNPTVCLQCHKPIEFEKKVNIYCSKKCTDLSKIGQGGKKGHENPMSKGYIFHTPEGTFNTAQEAGKANKCSGATIYNRSKNKYGIWNDYSIDIITKK